MKKEKLMERPELGDKVKDEVTGFVGIVTARTEWLYGCVRLLVQAAVNDKGEIEEGKMFDEPQLKVVRRGAVKNPAPVKVDYGGRDDKAATRR